jgi:hypothetical protein
MTLSPGSASGYGNGRLAMISALVPPVVSTASLYTSLYLFGIPATEP